VVPISRTVGWDAFKDFAHRVVEAIVRDAPEEFVGKASKAARRGRIFVDWLRNGRGATAVAPWSPRAREGAPVAVPVHWDEVDARLRPDRWTIRTVERRLAELGRHDPWDALAGTSQRLEPASRRLG
jgi:bifunctional non-homologous end joining protein LigD